MLYTTVNGYLNELPHGVGGRTRFLQGKLGIWKDDQGRFSVEDPETAVTHVVRPEVGAAVVFFHGLLHDGEPCKLDCPPKWIFRTEVMYRRDEASISSAIRNLTEAEVEARRLDGEAERIERTEPMQGMELYKLALRLRDGRITAETAQARAAILLKQEPTWSLVPLTGNL